MKKTFFKNLAFLSTLGIVLSEVKIFFLHKMKIFFLYKKKIFFFYKRNIFFFYKKKILFLYKKNISFTNAIWPARRIRNEPN